MPLAARRPALGGVRSTRPSRADWLRFAPGLPGRSVADIRTPGPSGFVLRPTGVGNEGYDASLLHERICVVGFVSFRGRLARFRDERISVRGGMAMPSGPYSREDAAGRAPSMSKKTWACHQRRNLLSLNQLRHWVRFVAAVWSDEVARCELAKSHAARGAASVRGGADSARTAIREIAVSVAIQGREPAGKGTRIRRRVRFGGRVGPRWDHGDTVNRETERKG